MPNTTQTAAKANPSQPKPVAKNNNKKDATGSKRFHAKGKQSKKREPESDEENDSSGAYLPRSITSGMKNQRWKVPVRQRW